MAGFQTSAQSGMAAEGRVENWLMQAGMGKYYEQFAGLSETVFRSLLMQDYGKYGVTSLEDKQRLFRLLKTVNAGGEPDAEPATPPKGLRQNQQAAGGIESFLSPELRADHGILDIHAMDDSDLLHDVTGPQSFSDPFLKSPSPPAVFEYQSRAYANGSDDEQFPVNNVPLPPTGRPPNSHRTSTGNNSNNSASARNAAIRAQANNNSSDDDYGGARPGGDRSKRSSGADDEYEYSGTPQRGGIVPSPRRPATPAGGETSRPGSGSGTPGGLARIRVVVRKRPINKKEVARREDDVVWIDEAGSALQVHEPRQKVDLTAYVEKHEFVFDAVLNDQVTNDEVYRLTVEPLVQTIFNKGRATCFAYGQTGSGKTYTMQPLPMRATTDIFQLMGSPQNHDLQLWLSYFEIYGGKVYDLLNDRRKLCMREDGRQQVCIVGLKEHRVEAASDVKDFLERGNSTRSTGVTGANEESSRSHAILQLALKKHKDGDFSRGGKLVGKFSFIDLAGSERGADTYDNDKQTRMEGAEINKSLLALKECIRALDHEQGHIPFRGSKLTEVLRDSFVGNSRTVMIANISPNAGSCEHTLNTLRYADRVKGLSKNQRTSNGGTAGPQSAPPVFVNPANPPQIPKPAADTQSQVPPLPPKLSSQYQKGGGSDRGGSESRQGGEFGSARGGGATERDGALPPIPTGGAEEVPSQIPVPRPSDRTTRHRERMDQIERDEGLFPDRGVRSRRGSASDMDPEPRYVPSELRYAPTETSEGTSGRVSRGGEANGGGASWQETTAGGSRRGSDTAEDARGEGTSLPPIGGRRKEGREETRSRRPSNSDAEERSSQRETAPAGHGRRRRSSGGVDNGAFEGVVELMDNDALLSAHDELMNAIMEEEEELVGTHRKEIEDGMEILREEMRLLADMDNPNSAVDVYVNHLTSLLARKAASLAAFQKRLADFKQHLKEEEVLSKSVSARQL